MVSQQQQQQVSTRVVVTDTSSIFSRDQYSLDTWSSSETPHMQQQQQQQQPPQLQQQQSEQNQHSSSRTVPPTTTTKTSIRSDETGPVATATATTTTPRSTTSATSRTSNQHTNPFDNLDANPFVQDQSIDHNKKTTTSTTTSTATTATPTTTTLSNPFEDQQLLINISTSTTASSLGVDEEDYNNNNKITVVQQQQQPQQQDRSVSATQQQSYSRPPLHPSAASPSSSPPTVSSSLEETTATNNLNKKSSNSNKINRRSKNKNEIHSEGQSLLQPQQPQDTSTTTIPTMSERQRLDDSLFHVISPSDETSEEQPSMDASSNDDTSTAWNTNGTNTTTPHNSNNTNSNNNTNSTTITNPLPSSLASPPPQEQQQQRWDSSDRHQFPILDIQRMKNKTNKLRTAAAIATSRHHRQTASNNDDRNNDHNSTQDQHQQPSHDSSVTPETPATGSPPRAFSHRGYNPFATLVSAVATTSTTSPQRTTTPTGVESATAPNHSSPPSSSPSTTSASTPSQSSPPPRNVIRSTNSNNKNYEGPSTTTNQQHHHHDSGTGGGGLSCSSSSSTSGIGMSLGASFSNGTSTGHSRTGASSTMSTGTPASSSSSNNGSQVDGQSVRHLARSKKETTPTSSIIHPKGRIWSNSSSSHSRHHHHNTTCDTDVSSLDSASRGDRRSHMYRSSSVLLRKQHRWEQQQQQQQYDEHDEEGVEHNEIDEVSSSFPSSSSRPNLGSRTASTASLAASVVEQSLRRSFHRSGRRRRQEEEQQQRSKSLFQNQKRKTTISTQRATNNKKNKSLKSNKKNKYTDPTKNSLKDGLHASIAYSDEPSETPTEDLDFSQEDGETTTHEDEDDNDDSNNSNNNNTAMNDQEQEGTRNEKDDQNDQEDNDNSDDDDDDDDEHDHEYHEAIEPDFTLHDLCGEACSTDDVAWRNALYILSMQPELALIRDGNGPDLTDNKNMVEQKENDNDDDDDNEVLVRPQENEESDGHGWTPLHISCLGMHPPPQFIIRALLQANPKAVKWRDDGGRLPLHLVAASSGDINTMELLLQTWPHAISKRDYKGLTPLHLLLRNKSIPLTTGNTSLLLGFSLPSSSWSMDSFGSNRNYNKNMNKNTNKQQQHPRQQQQRQQEQQQKRYILQRRGDHLNMSLQDMDEYISNRHKLVTTVFNPDYSDIDEEWNTYPPDVQGALRRLAKWKKKKKQKLQQREQQQERQRWKKNKSNNTTYFCDIMDEEDEEEDEDEEDTDLYGEINPAAIVNYPDLKLPIHMAVERGIVQPVPLLDDSMQVPERFQDDPRDDEDDDDVEDQEIGSQATAAKTRKKRVITNVLSESEASQSPSSVEDVYNVLRCIIAAYPEGLCIRDADGKTPLLHVMTMTGGLPSLEMIDLLLGKRSGAFQDIPPWLVDLPLHSLNRLPDSHNRMLCPAMVSSGTTDQLPLHIAAEEFLSDTAIVESVYESYPAAVDVQDHRGRTPLHLLLSNYRLFPVNPKVMALLLSTSSAKCRDMDGNAPFDLLVHGANHLPKRLPTSWEACDMARIYQRFFTASLLLPSFDGNQQSNSSSEFLAQLRQLPPWIRRQACCVQFVQELIIEELASPWRTACIVMDGFLLVLVLTLFRMEVKDYTNALSDPEELSEKSYALFVIVLTWIRLVMLSCRALLSVTVNQLDYLVLRNGWFWLDGSAMIVTFVTATLMNDNDDDSGHSAVLTMATVATGMLWLSLFGYCVTWFFGMSILWGTVMRLANQVLWPILAGGMLMIAFAQMFLTLLGTNCTDAIPSTQVCTTRDSYRVIYLLLRGETLVDTDGTATNELSTKAIVLVFGFLVLLLTLLVVMLVAIIMGSLHTNIEEISHESFWEPKLAIVISSSSDMPFCCGPILKFKNKLKITPTQEQQEQQEQKETSNLQIRLERLWDVLVSSVLFVGWPASSCTKTKTIRTTTSTEKYWYAGPQHPSHWYSSIPFWLMSCLIVPVWFFMGFLTLGLLWPPQLRRLLFRPMRWHNCNQQQQQQQSFQSSSLSPSFIKSEYNMDVLSDIRSDLCRIKTMSYERSVHVEKEIRAVKQILYAAIRDA